MLQRALAWAAPRARATVARRDPLAVLVAAIVLAALLACSLAVAVRAGAPADSAASRLNGSALPAVLLPAERGGTPIAAQPLAPPGASHPSLIVFFGTLCPHCPRQLAAVAALGAATPALAVIYVDAPAESPAAIAAYMGRLGISAPVLLDRGAALSARLGIAYTPAVVLVDRAGVVRHVWTGETATATIAAAVAALPA
ncbi:MAG: TlpA disulfide reductase family protein [Ktedonobacterales bacterium]